MYQSRQRIGATTEYAVEKKFERRAEGIIAAAAAVAVGRGRRREPFKCKESNHGTKPRRRIDARSLGVGCAVSHRARDNMMRLYGPFRRQMRREGRREHDHSRQYLTSFTILTPLRKKCSVSTLEDVTATACLSAKAGWPQR